MKNDLPARLWLLAEKLCLHCYGLKGLGELLREYNIQYNNSEYEDYDIQVFMTSSKSRFSDFMKTQESSKSLSLLEAVFFDERINNSVNSNHDYYGEKVCNWYPELNILIEQRYQINVICKKLEEYNSKEPSLLIVYNFNDPFLDYIRKEINECFERENNLATLMLSRKLIECLIVRIYELYFPKWNKDRETIEENINLYLTPNRDRPLNLSVLVENLINKSDVFMDDRKMLIDTCNKIKSILKELNRMVHRDYKNPTYDSFDEKKIISIVYNLRKIFDTGNKMHM